MNAQDTKLFSLIVKTAERLRLEADHTLLESAGITAAQGAVMAVIQTRPSATQSDIAQALDLSEPAVTQMIGRLLREGLINRERDKDDRRRWRLSLTQSGEEKAEQAHQAFAPINDLLDRALGEDGVAAFSAQLISIRAALKQDADL